MTSLPTEKLEIAPNVLFEEIDGETVLLDLAGESYFGLNEVGTEVWQQLGEGRQLGVILEALLSKYDVSREQLEADVGRLLDELLAAGLVRWQR